MIALVERIHEAIIEFISIMALKLGRFSIHSMTKVGIFVIQIPPFVASQNIAGRSSFLVLDCIRR